MMFLSRGMVHLRKLLVDADVSQLRTQESQTDGSTVIEGLQVREPLAGRGAVGNVFPQAGGEP